MQKAIGYIRVSTGKQGKSGLGIEAQRHAIARFTSTEGMEVVDEFVEVAEALSKARKVKAPGDRSQTLPPFEGRGVCLGPNVP